MTKSMQLCASTDLLQRLVVAACVAVALPLFAQAAPEIVIERHFVDVDGDWSVDELRLVRPPDWNDPGDYVAIEVHLASGKVLRSEEILGVNWANSFQSFQLQQRLFMESRVLSKRIMVLFNGSDLPPLILATEWAFASSPGRVVALVVKDNSIRRAIDQKFIVSDLALLNRRWTLAGRPCHEGRNNLPNYSPTLVWSFNNATLTFDLDVDLSTKRSLAAQGVWNGTDCGDSWAVVKGTNGLLQVMDWTSAQQKLKAGEVQVPVRTKSGTLQ